MSASDGSLGEDELEVHCAAAERCGGCPRIGQSRLRQRHEKRRALWELLEASGIDTASLDEAVPEAQRWSWAPSPVGYRNRIRLRLDDGAPRFFNPNKVPECSVLEPSLRQWLAEFERWSTQHTTDLASFSHAELRGRDLDDKVGLELSPGPAPNIGWSTLATRMAASLSSDVLFWVRGVGPAPLQRVGLGSGAFTYVPLGSFCQVNSAVNRALIERVVCCVCERGHRRFVDAFCGAGNFSLPLLVAGCEGVGVERDEAAITALRRAAREQGVDASGFRAESTATAARRWSEQGLRTDVVVIDPPRAGAKDALDALLDLQPSTLLLVSCNPRSFGADLLRARRRGFGLERLWLGDMFPHTDHVEVLAQLERR